MAITALNSAATGLRALSTRIDVIANNLANAETTAFKSSRMNFEDLMYQTLKQPGAQNAAGDLDPAGIQVGLGVKISNTQLMFDQGSLDTTNRQLDVAIQGNGFFRGLLLRGRGALPSLDPSPDPSRAWGQNRQVNGSCAGRRS